MSVPTVAVVGFPNVGKSTLVNRLAGGREAVTHREAGVTSDRKRVPCEWNGVAFDLLDTGGIDIADESELAVDVRRQARLGIAEADVVLLVVDGTAGIRAGDAEVAKELRGSDRPTLVVVNKVDRPGDEHLTADSTPSASASRSPSPPATVSEPATCSTSCRAPRRPPAHRRWRRRRQGRGGGRPNAGKSSLVNAFLGSERTIVSDRAGTTRDSIDTELEVDGRRVILVDTAGLRRRSKVAGSIDYYAQLRSERAVERADVALVVCDASEGVTAEDLRVAELAMKAGCATLLALNKWDITTTDIDDARAGSSENRGCARRSSPPPPPAGATSPTSCRRRSSSPTRPPSGSPPPSSTGSSTTSSRRRRHRRAAAADCASTTRRRSGSNRRGSRSRSTTGA